MALPNPGFSKRIEQTPYAVEGIQYYPISSSNVFSPSNGIGFTGATEKSFTFASSGPTPYTYLTIDLLEYSNPTQSLLSVVDYFRDNKVPSTIIVKGSIIPLPGGNYGANIEEEDKIYFEHVFLTDWHSSSVVEEISFPYSFEEETSVETAYLQWTPNPQGPTSGWVNGLGCVNGSTWDPSIGRPTKGWNLGLSGTTSGNTGPNGGVNINNSNFPGGTSNGSAKYMYGETSSSGSASSTYAYDRWFVARTNPFNFTTLPSVQDINNPKRLKFYVHGFGANIGHLTIGVSQFTSETSASVITLGDYPSDSWTQTSSTSPYDEVIINLPPSIYTANVNWYFYFIYNPEGSSYFGDLAIDRIVFEEDLGVTPHWTSDFYYEIAPGSAGTLLNGEAPTIFNWEGNPTSSANVEFQLDTSNGAYIKGTYLLL